MGIVARVGSWAAHHRRVVLVGWIVLLVGSLGISHAVGTNYSTNFSLPGTESQRATDLLKRDFPAQSGDSDQIVLRARKGQITDAAVRAHVEPMLKEVAALPHVTGVVSPYSPAGAHAVSSDGQIAFATVNFDKRANLLPKASIENVISTAERARSNQLEVQLGGQAIEQAQKPSLGTATAVGLLAAMIILFITFGSLAGDGSADRDGAARARHRHRPGGPGLADHRRAELRDRACGHDRARRRHRLRALHRDALPRELPSGRELQPAINDAMDSAGRAVLFAGVTVIIALLGQFLLGVSFLYGLAVASSLAVLMTMLAALTVCPPRSPASARASDARAARAGECGEPGAARRGGFWASWANRSNATPGQGRSRAWRSCSRWRRRRSRYAWATATPATTRPATPPAGLRPVAKGFGPGSNGPLLVVASLPHADDSAALASVASTLKATANVATSRHRA